MNSKYILWTKNSRFIARVFYFVIKCFALSPKIIVVVCVNLAFSTASPLRGEAGWKPDEGDKNI